MSDDESIGFKDHGKVVYQLEWKPREKEGYISGQWGKCCCCGQEALCLTWYVLSDEHIPPHICEFCIKRVFAASRQTYWKSGEFV
jgi:uncharacterized protein CbrC (UPF0167 family)